MPKTEKPYTPSSGNSGMQSDKAPIPKAKLPAPAPVKGTRVGKRPKSL